YFFAKSSYTTSCASLRNLPVPLRLLLREIFLYHFVCFFAKSSCTTSCASLRTLPVPLRVFLCELFPYHFVCFFAHFFATSSCTASCVSPRPIKFRTDPKHELYSTAGAGAHMPLDLVLYGYSYETGAYLSTFLSF